MTRTVTAMFATKAEADKAGQMLVSQLGLDPSKVRTSPGEGVADTGYDAARPYEEKGFFASLKDMFLPDEDRYAYAEGMRRGAALLTATIDEAQLDRASDVLEHAGAVDLDEQEATWRQSGWKGYDAEAHTAYRSSAAVAPSMPVAPALPATAPVAPAAAMPNSDTIKVVQERLVVGKRAVESGRVKVRAYVVERPVEETVRLHEETVHVDRHAVDRPASAADLEAAFQERTIEATAMSEMAVVSKEARVVEEIGIHKDAVDRAETVHDTVRETKVDVVDDTSGATGTVRPVGKPSVAGGATGTGVAAAIDRTLDTNLSGTNPGRS